MNNKIVIFDLGGVLINLNVTRCMLAFEALMGEQNMRAILGMDKNGEGVKAVSIATKQLMADFERGLISPEYFIEQVLQHCRPGTTPQQVIDTWMSMLVDLPQERLDAVDQVRAKGYKVYLLSNGNDLHFNYINQTYHLAPHFDGLFLSQKMYLAKPEPEIYLAVNEQIIKDFVPSTEPQNPLLSPANCPADSPSLSPSEVLFIDDIEANRLAAEQTVGWTTFPDIPSLLSALDI